MRCQNIDQDWEFMPGVREGFLHPSAKEKIRPVNLPHDYMIESEVTESAVSQGDSGFYTAGPASYTKFLQIPQDWDGEEVYLHFDGVMMNATVVVNKSKVALQHNGYIPFSVNITPYLYFGRINRVTVITHPGTHPNSRWYSGAGIFRSAWLLHMPKLHIAHDGIYGYTKEIEFDEHGKAVSASLRTQVEIQNETLEHKIALVEVFLTRDGSDEVLLSRSQKIEAAPNGVSTAYVNLTLQDPCLWDIDHPELYRIHARVTDLGVFKTHLLPAANPTVDETDVLFGIRTITADPKHGLRINGKTVKLKGGCLHHDNGMLGAVSLYSTEARKIAILKEIGFNAIRTTHNPPSAALMEACDRLGMYVFDEAFDAWGTMKRPGDYNQFFDTDWEKDLALFMKRDRNHPSVILWSTGNEIEERGGLYHGFTLATRIAEAARALDSSRPISNAICSWWFGLDDEQNVDYLHRTMGMTEEDATALVNADGGRDDVSFDGLPEPFTNGLDIVGYNYYESRYESDHEKYPERVILGSENYAKEVGLHWPMIENTPYVIGEFTWTAVDYIGEVGIGKSVFIAPEELEKKGPGAMMSIRRTGFPWRLANDADVDINGNILPQGAYRSVVWGSSNTFLFSYDPAVTGMKEMITPWGFTDVRKCWNWPGLDGKETVIAVFSNGDEVELLQNGKTVGKCRAGEKLAADLPKTFVFSVFYQPGTLEAISYKSGKEISRDSLSTTGAVKEIRLIPETKKFMADGHDTQYIKVELVDENCVVVPTAEIQLKATLEGPAQLAAFGSSNPITSENYTSGSFTSFRGCALAIVRSGLQTGSCKLTVSAEGLMSASVTFGVEC